MKTILIRTHSPLHIGVGQSPSALDLPIARDRVTGAPYLPGTSLKGAFRARYHQSAQDERSSRETELFGPLVRGDENASDYAGALEFHDGHLLLFPVASPTSGWVWLTSPLLLSELYKSAGDVEREAMPALPQPASHQALTPHEMNSEAVEQGRCWVRDLDFEHQESAELLSWADLLASRFQLDPHNTKYLHRRLLCLHDDTLALIWRHMTTIVTRNRVDPATGIVVDGALWNEELVPPETFFIARLSVIAARSEALNSTPEELMSEVTSRCASLTLGGKVSVGRGLCSVTPMYTASSPVSPQPSEGASL